MYVQCGPNKLSHYEIIENRVKSYISLPMRLYYKKSVGIKYSLRDLLFDVNNYV